MTTAPVSVRSERRGAVAVITLQRPEVRNALNLTMCLELIEAFGQVADDSDVAAVLLRGAGPTFCAGADLTERQGRDAAWIGRRRAASFEAYAAIEECPAPTIALLHGNVIGSGGEMAMTCDFGFAATDVSFRFPEAHWGTIGATQRLQRVIGIRKAKELLLTNGSLDAAEAERLGLVQRVVPVEELLDLGLRTAELIATAPRSSIRLTKRAMDDGRDLSLAAGIEVERAAIEQNLSGTAWQQGLDRFRSNPRGLTPEVAAEEADDAG